MLRILLALATAALLLIVPAGASGQGFDVNDSGEIVVDDFYYGVFAGGEGLVAARFDAGLDLVTSFGRNGYHAAGPLERPGMIRSVPSLAEDGSVTFVRAGSSSGPIGTSLQRLLPDGTPDEAFGRDGFRLLPERASIHPFKVLRREDGTMIVAGSMGSGSSWYGQLVALRPDGTLDESFGDAGVVAATGFGSPTSAHLMPDGRVLLASGPQLARFEADGDPDPTFGTGGRLTLDGFGWSVAPSGTGVIAARGIGEEGIEARRVLQDGSPDPDWGDGGRTVLPLDATPSTPENDPHISYSVPAVLVRAGGDAVLGARREELSSEDPSDPHVSGVPLLLDADGGFVRAGDRGPRIGRIEPMPGGGFATHAVWDYDECGCLPGNGMVNATAIYAPDATHVASARLKPVLTPPDARIVSGPPAEAGAVTGPDATFDLEAVPAAMDDGDAVLRCSVGEGPFRPCPADGTFRDLPEGPAVLRVAALGIHSAWSEIQDYEWTVNHRAPATTITRSPSGTTRDTAARIEFAADEPATFACRVDGGAAAPCDGALELKDLGPGEHRVTVQATDRLGAVEPAPPTATWTVASADAGPQPEAPKPEAPKPEAPKPPPTGQRGPRAKVLVVGKVRKGRVRVRFLPFDTGQVQLSARVVFRGKDRAAGTRVVRTRAGQARTVVLRLNRRGRRIFNRAAARGDRPAIRVAARMIEG